VGSVKGEEAIAISKAKEDERLATSSASVAKKELSKEKKARDTIALVTPGSEIMKRLEQLGPNELLRLKVDELHALLANTGPHGSITKPNKKKHKRNPTSCPLFKPLFIVFNGSISICRARNVVASDSRGSIDLRGREHSKCGISDARRFLFASF
jgi:hypothetical protein